MNLVKKWSERIPNKHTRKLYVCHVKWFCKMLDVTPEELVNKNSPEQNEELIQRCLDAIRKGDLKRDTVNLQAGVNGFLRFYDVKHEADNGKLKDGRGRFKTLPEKERVYGWLLEYDVINQWIVYYRADNTRRGYLSSMSKFLQENELTPDDLLEMDAKKLTSIFREASRKYQDEKKDSMANQLYRVLKSFCEEHDIDIRLKKKDRVSVIGKRIIDQHVLSREEVYRIADNSGTIRGRALILSLAQSGVRNNSIRRWTYGMVKEGLYPELKIPVRLKITKEIDTKISKYIPYYYTFLQDEAADSLKSYIEWRKEEYGWQPKDDDLIFVSNTGKPMTQTSINDTMNRAAKNSGLDPESVWAHLLRKFFRKKLYGAVDSDLAEALMGHQIGGSKENYFDRHDVDWIADEYMKAPFSREGVGRVNHLEREVKEKEERIEKLEHAVRTLATSVKDLKGMEEKESKKIKWKKVASYTEEDEEDEWKTLEEINGKKHAKEGNNTTTNNDEVGELFEELKNNKKFKANGKKNAKG